MIFGNGVSVGAVAILSSLLGAGKKDKARGIANLAFWLMLVSSLVLGVACWWWSQPLIDLQAGSGLSADQGREYLEVLSLGTFTMFLLMHITGVMRAMGNAVWPVALMFGSNALNIALDFALVFGWDAVGIPALGPVGAGWASVISRFLGCIVGFVVLARPSSPLPLGMALPRDTRDALRRIVALGVPQSVQMFVRASLVLTATRFAGQLGGRPAQAALSIATRLDTVVLFAAVGWAGGATAMIGQAAGRDMVGRCHQVAWVTALWTGISSLAIGLAFWVWSEPIYLLFVPDGGQAFLDAGWLYFAILAFAHPAASASLVLAGSLNGVRSSFVPMLFDFAVYGLLLQPGLWVWRQTGAAGGLGTCWAAILAANWALLGVYAFYMYRPNWVRLPEKLSSASPDYS